MQAVRPTYVRLRITYIPNPPDHPQLMKCAKTANEWHGKVQRSREIPWTASGIYLTTKLYSSLYVTLDLEQDGLVVRAARGSCAPHRFRAFHESSNLSTSNNL
jgi:hypothetical protein